MSTPNPMALHPGVTTVPTSRPMLRVIMQPTMTQRVLARSAKAPVIRVAANDAAIWGRKLPAASIVVSPLSPRRLIWWKATAVESAPETATPLVTSQKKGLRKA